MQESNDTEHESREEITEAVEETAESIPQWGKSLIDAVAALRTEIANITINPTNNVDIDSSATETPEETEETDVNGHEPDNGSGRNDTNPIQQHPYFKRRFGSRR